MAKQENTLAEAYVPFFSSSGTQYSAICFGKEEAAALDPSSPLYQYLQALRTTFQPRNGVVNDIMYSIPSDCGQNHRFKIVQPLTLGSYTPGAPCQRFFLDRDNLSITPQSLYVTLANPSKAKQMMGFIPSGNCTCGDDEFSALCEEATYLFFTGLLNSSRFRFFSLTCCRHDVDGHLRFYSGNVARLPYAPPTPIHAQTTALLVQVQIDLRDRIFAMISDLPKGQSRPILDKVRSLTWDLDQSAIDIVNQHVGLVDSEEEPPCNNAMDLALAQGGGSASDRLIRLMVAQSLMQHAIEHVVYDLYKVPWDLRERIEREQDLTLNAQWENYQIAPQQQSPLQLAESILNGSTVVQSIVIS